MRNAFADELTRLATGDPRVVLLSGDIGNRLFDGFKASCPGRFFNCGVAEGGMVGAAAGLALTGLRPIVYTIASFLVTRAFEQIRVDLCYHRAPVVIVGVGAGLGYASLGPTHHALEDVAILRAVPGMAVVCPGDPDEVRQALRAALAWDGPVYLRLGKKGEPAVHRSTPAFAIGRAIVLSRGVRVRILALGALLPVAVETAARLDALGLATGVCSFHTVKPLDEQRLEEDFAAHDLVVVLEEHGRLGGLGGAIAEWLSERRGPRARLLRLGTPDRFLPGGGSTDSAREALGLTPQALAARIASELEAVV